MHRTEPTLTAYAHALRRSRHRLTTAARNAVLARATVNNSRKRAKREEQQQAEQSTDESTDSSDGSGDDGGV
jgi:hypothetical protein